MKDVNGTDPAILPGLTRLFGGMIALRVDGGVLDIERWKIPFENGHHVSVIRSRDGYTIGGKLNLWEVAAVGSDGRFMRITPIQESDVIGYLTEIEVADFAGEVAKFEPDFFGYGDKDGDLEQFTHVLPILSETEPRRPRLSLNVDDGRLEVAFRPENSAGEIDSDGHMTATLGDHHGTFTVMITFTKNKPDDDKKGPPETSILPC